MSGFAAFGRSSAFCANSEPEALWYKLAVVCEYMGKLHMLTEKMRLDSSLAASKMSGANHVAGVAVAWA